MNIRDRIKELRRVKASGLRPNPKNWRKHPQSQADALRGLLAEVGYVDALLARELPDGGLMLIDGHLRAETTPEAEVPVLILDVSEAEADKILASFDPLSAMAEADPAKLDELLREVETGSEALAAMLEELRLTEEPIVFDTPPESISENIEEIEAIKTQRRKGNAATASERDTEHYLIIVYPTRATKEAALKRLGLPEDERYIPAGSVTIKGRGAIKSSGKQSADPSKSGATG